MCVKSVLRCTLCVMLGHAALSSSAQTFSAHSVYSPDHLPAGSILQPTVDGWYKHEGSSAPTFTDLIVVDSGGSRGRILVGTSEDGVGAFRKNDSFYAFRTLSADETFSSLMDVRVRTSPGNHGVFFALGADGSTDSDTVADELNEVGPQFGLGQAPSGGRPLTFRIRQAGYGAFTEIPVNGLALDGDWVRLKFVVNLGSGTGSLFQRNLSRGAIAFSPVSGLQGVDLALSRMDAGAGPTAWNHMYLRVDSSTNEPAQNSEWIDTLVPVASDNPPPRVGGLGVNFDAETVVYTYEGLTSGSLVSPVQDGWARDSQYSSSQNIRVESLSTNTYIQGNSLIGLVAIRKNNNSFSIPPIDASRPLTSYVDILARDTNAGINALFALGHDVNADGGLQSVELGPAFGLLKNVNNLSRPLSFLIRAAANGALTYYPAAGLVADGEWVRLKFVQDFSSGTGLLAYLNLSRGQTEFTVLLTDVSLGLSALNSSATPGAWDAMAVRIDSLSFGATGAFAMGMDNLVPNSDEHPFGTAFRASPSSLLAEDMSAGLLYRVVRRAALGDPGSTVHSFRPYRDTHQCFLPPQAGAAESYYAIEVDQALAQ